MDHADRRYLEAKRSVDDRALSWRVRDRFLAALPTAPNVLEAGCGTGVTVPRLLSWGVDDGTYLGVDRDPGVVEYARRDRLDELDDAGYDATATQAGFEVEGLSVGFETGDALSAFDGEQADAVLAQAFADLVSLDDALAAFDAALAPGGLAYLPITFDGGTIFQPDHPADDAVERAYHRAIDAQPGRDSRAGRHLLDRLRAGDGDLLAVASSDWVVRPHDGAYPGDERYFLERILGFVEDALGEGGQTVDGFDDWLAARRRHLADGTLTYVAHQYDLLYRYP